MQKVKIKKYIVPDYGAM